MTFQEAVEGTASICDSYRSGLKALRRNDRSHIECRNTRRLTGSVNLDDALRQTRPNEPRWDYGVGVRRSRAEAVVWIEVHPASSSHVETVLGKLKWLRDWLAKDAPRLLQLTDGEFYWVATNGPVNITANSPQAKLLAKHGLRGPTRVLRLQ